MVLTRTVVSEGSLILPCTATWSVIAAVCTQRRVWHNSNRPCRPCAPRNRRACQRNGCWLHPPVDIMQICMVPANALQYMLKTECTKLTYDNPPPTRRRRCCVRCSIFRCPLFQGVFMYWIPSSLFQASQTLAMRNENVRLFLGLQPLQQAAPPPAPAGNAQLPSKAAGGGLPHEAPPIAQASLTAGSIPARGGARGNAGASDGAKSVQ